jgi:hypothetical protein
MSLDPDLVADANGFSWGIDVGILLNVPVINSSGLTLDSEKISTVHTR